MAILSARAALRVSFLLASTSVLLSSAQSLAPGYNLPTNWTYTGCYNDTTASRTLAGSNKNDGQNMDAYNCISYCQAKNYVYAGTEYSDDMSPRPNSSCTMACTGNSTEVCGGPNRITIYYANKPAPKGPFTNPGPANWTSFGCWTDGNPRTLKNGKQVPGGASNMTVAGCTSTCAAAGYTLAGVEYAGECYCDNYMDPSSTNATISDCNMPCNGNSSEFCGAGNRLDIYAFGTNTPSATPSSTSSATSTPVASTVNTAVSTTKTAASTTNTTASITNTAASTTNTTSSTMKTTASTTSTTASIINTAASTTNTTSSTTKTAASTTNTAASTTNTTASITNTAASTTNTTASTTTTTASTPTSTGPSVAIVNGWSSLGCYNDSVNSRTLQFGQNGLGSMTVEKCTAACSNAGYSLAGVEYGAECYCDNAFKNSGGPAPDGSAGCNMACAGASSELCGGSNRLNVYSVNATASTGTSSTGTVASTGATTSPTASSAVNATAILPFKYQGCYTDNAANSRTLAYQQNDNHNLTVESCIAQCSSLGYTIAGMEYSYQCFCDSFIHNTPSTVADSQCNMACPGNSNENCGAGNRLSLYSNGTLTTAINPTVHNSSLPGNWVYQGCLTDMNGDDRVRSLPYEMDFPKNNSNPTCLSLCQAYGYGAAGTEYSDQCFCGDVTDVAASGATIVDDSQCNMLCANDTGKNGGHYCGGQNRISYYTWSGTPLNSWNVATGSAAGAYQFLVGGVVIPLVTQPARNGKVTFLEKFGTELAANSSGAYELDVTMLNNFTAAWRPMHVKTDIFCSASLTLPDRAGRQINVGGWSLDSTFGVRLYWPDGKPGVWGQNDWQENGNEVKLLNGRWYPTAMSMANGSILVMGGEAGSNGAAVPTLEVLPSPSGQVQFCDYLNRTDPNNLYPYLAVLPSGDIFVAYYNEARVLDSGTLQTKRVLPNIPGAVNNPAGGRTYPLEGTAMLLPQYAPYSAPLGVIICGGSTPYSGVALDNCASIQPDTPNANWTLERMPSKRVISCMTALPDGTYLILNGAQQGQAGFGLAINPNLNAVLYDPTKAVGARMTIMANTTVARMYHSEAVLLDDGRVLVSGSDPEDSRFPQEYRNEVFLPPYLTSQAKRPVMNLTTLDWTYGQQVTLQIVSAGSGSVSNYRVSLMASVGSTHGNSMGQRTIFPATSCSGTTCTVTAPPNANVAPPAWFQVFLLDANNVPSNATWVRIGGDPAKLGNWPNSPDFNTPGMGAVTPLF